MKFPCSGCGGCCKVLKLNHESLKVNGRFTKEHEKFPYGYNSDGSCEMLGSDGKCKVYEDRPKTCRADYMIRKSAGLFGNRKKVTNNYIDGCNVIIDHLGIDKSFKISKV